MKRAVVAGCGYVGRIVARLLVENGWSVTGITRSQASADALADEPFAVCAGDLADRDALAKFGQVELVVHCASSGRGGAEAYESVYRIGAQNLMEMLTPQRFIFTGSTSVYAQTEGETVDETSPASPIRETGKVLRRTEDLVLTSSGSVARLAGIYGPDRSVMLRKFLEGRAVIEGDGARWINQIHRDDAASALTFLAKPETPSGIYNVCDDEPMTQRDVYTWLAEYLGKPLPPSGPIDLDRKRGWTNKRVSNAKLRALGWVPRYGSFRDALPSLGFTRSS